MAEHDYTEDDLFGLEENAVRVRATVELTDEYFDTISETRQTLTQALLTDFERVEVKEIAVVPEVDPTTGIVHYPGIED